MDALREVEGRIFDKKFEWESIDKAQALENKRVLDLIREACLIEAYFGIYVANMISLLKEDLEATSMFTIEGFEAYSHYYILRKYLDIINYKPIKDEEILAIREKFYPISKVIYTLAGRVTDGPNTACSLGVLGMIITGLCLFISTK
ncbi:MAG: hypothetical protein QXH60_00315, partial [Candidatus Pacearchaeota archaeon]